jgi:hypothetical protein
MIIEIAALTYILGSYAYHRWFEDKPVTQVTRPASEIAIPRVDDGARVPLIYGRCRVRSPWLAYAGTPTATETPAGSGLFVYGMDLFYVVGVGFHDDADNRLHHVWVDDYKLRGGDLGTVPGDMTGPEVIVDNVPSDGNVGFIGSFLEYLNGNSSQLLADADAPYATHGFAAQRMAAAAGSGVNVPSYRGYMSVFFYNHPNPAAQWSIGNSPRPGAYSFEVHSYPTVPIGPTTQIGDDANPIDVLANAFVGSRCKMGIPTTKLDTTSWAAAALTCLSEQNGYSRAVEDADTCDDVVEEILKQVDGLLFEDQISKRWKIKLVRPDYDPSTVVIVHPGNARLQRSPAGSRSNLTNKIRVVYTDRSNDYQENSVTAQNHADAARAGGTQNELVLRYPGVTTSANARKIAERELSARSRSIMKIRAVCDRTLVRVNPGDVVAVTWPDWNLDGVLFRVAGASRGTRESGEITLDLIQEFYNYRRGVLGGANTIGSFPAPADPFIASFAPGLSTPSEQVIESVDLVIGTNVIAHSLGRDVVGVDVTPSSALSSFAWSINRANPDPSTEVWIDVVGDDMPDCTVRVY